ncbi:polysaccharide biosynthesis protein [Levilactobacillus suantsaii]|uniref:Polysaccharide biosynthesis protein n=1 Tax=Levilactobacillus suantsaii TaxID=2292255 RepID=A0A4Q0VK30_9LACO|nr:polysaccharide biosynthesis protein [Levilactobacillus suantsaii]QMU07030.1 polysaccharide biosynthesis protein [Levilactobacillus suantsaii]RXI78359.1 polysaccharide biosynthesis protein [Levilactobacillus suantsaii]
MGARNVTQTLRGALVLSSAAFIAKVLSAIYRVPFQNLVGDTGFYVYQQVYPLYGIGMTLALSGLPVFISKLVADAPDLASQQWVARRVYHWTLGLAVGLFLALQLGAPGLALGMGDTRLTALIRMVSWMFLVMPELAVSRGYYQGRLQMFPTARSQVIEQLVRVVIILVVAWWATTHDWSVYAMGTGTMVSGTLAALAAWAALPHWRRPVSGPVTATPHLGRRLLVEGGTLCLLTAIMVVLQLIDSFTVKNGLVAGGMSNSAAKSLKGVYDRAQPLVQLGLVVAVAFATSLLPALTSAAHHRQAQTFKRLTTTMMRLALVIATAASAGLITLMPWINQLLFGDAKGTEMLAIYMGSIVFATLIQTYNSVLQSRNQFKLTVVALLSGLVVKASVNQTAVHLWGGLGASLVTVGSLAVMTAIIWFGSAPQLRRGIWTVAFGVKLIGCLAGMVATVTIAKLSLQALIPALTQSRLAIGGALVVVIGVGVVVFIVAALSCRLLTVREWLTLPHAAGLLRYWQKLTQHGGK